MGTGGSNFGLVSRFMRGQLRNYFEKHGWPGEEKPKHRPRDGKRGQRRGRR